MIKAFSAWLERRDWDEGATSMVFGALISLAGGPYRPLLTGLGVWGAWFVLHRTGTPAGQNVPDVQLAVAKRDGVIRFRPVTVRTVASALTLGSGASDGSVLLPPRRRDCPESGCRRSSQPE